MTVYQPREDSRLLAKKVLEMDLDGEKCLDMGTGTGIIAEKMVKSGAEKVLAVDVNPEAVEEASEKLDEQDEVEVKSSDLFEDVEGEFDLIAFNPPYLPGDDLDKDLEGREIWRGGDSGEEFTEEFLETAEDYLAENGCILFIVSSLSDFDTDQYEIVDTKQLWFEDIYLLKAGNF
jgi:release factor glutamine methyltransferase